MKHAYAVTLATLIVAAAGCSSEPAAPVDRNSEQRHLTKAQAQIAAAVQGRRSRGFEDEILRMEAQIPGLGGVSADGAGHPVVYLKDMNGASAAMAQLRSFASSMNIQSDFRAQLGASKVT